MKYRILTLFNEIELERWINLTAKDGYRLVHFTTVFSQLAGGTRYTAVMEKNETKD